MSEKKIPVTVLTGFLGAGKTTLLNRILSEQHGQRIAVIENEMGALGVDDALVVRRDDLVVELSNGCVCCTSLGDLVPILEGLAALDEPVERVLVETTGIADPGPVARTFVIEPSVKRHFELDGIVTVVDAHHIDQHLEDDPWSCSRQIALADRIIVNKVDLVDKRSLAHAMTRVRQHNVTAPCEDASFANVPVAALLTIGGWGQPVPQASNHGHGHNHMMSLSYPLKCRLDPYKLDSFLSLLLREYGADMVRIKGLIPLVAQSKLMHLQGVHAAIDTRLSELSVDSVVEPRCVFIGRNLDEGLITEGLRACAAPGDDAPPISPVIP